MRIYDLTNKYIFYTIYKVDIYIHMWVQFWIVVDGTVSDLSMNPVLEVMCDLIHWEMRNLFLKSCPFSKKNWNSNVYAKTLLIKTNSFFIVMR